MRGFNVVLLIVGLLAPGAAIAQSPVFRSPVDCALQDVCWVVQYFDHDPGPAAADYTGGTRSYDGHDGTDIGISSYIEMARGIPVVAAADGVVGGTRDGMEDHGHGDFDRASVEGRECGNGVRINHGGGWQTLYCHLRQGSIDVTEGQRVMAGQVVGLIGQSGMAQFPHVEFGVLHGDENVDPFDPSGGMPLWTNQAAQSLAYSPMDIYHIGFADQAPDWQRVQNGAYGAVEFVPTADALVFWVEIFSVQAGDIVRIDLIGPDGDALVENSETLERTQSRIFRFVGKKKPGATWPVGEYNAEITISRLVDGRPIERSRRMTATIR